MRTLRCKVILAGSAKAGKTALARVFHANNFPKAYSMTATAELIVKNVHIPDSDTDVELYIFDSAGHDLYKEHVSLTWKNANILMLVYDCTSEQSFRDLHTWLEMAQNAVDGRILPGVVIANKTDLTDRVAVQSSRGADFAATNGLEFFECSAALGKDVDSPFYFIANKFYRSYEEKAQMMLASK